MKNIKSLLMLAAITVASMTFVSCDDDPWYDGYWHDPYGWSDNYGDWHWNNDYWNQGGNGNNQEDGESRSTDVYYTTMKFFQYNQNSKSYSGEGVETDYLLDSQGNVIEDKSQTLDFSWYIEDNGDIYIKYKNSGATFVLDYGSSQAGFHLGYDTFFGYMIGTGSVKGDVIYFDFKRLNDTNNAKAQTRGADVTEHKSFGKAAYQSPIKGTTSRFNSRR